MSKINYWTIRIGSKKGDNYIGGFNLLSHMTELSSIGGAIRFDSLEESIEYYMSGLSDSGNPEILDGKIHITHVMPNGKKNTNKE